MVILPAIDIRNGKCVRLFQGDYDQETIYGNSPLEMALKWQEMGATHLHLVDLDAAKAGHLVNASVVEEIAQKTDMFIEYGGGVRQLKDIETLLAWGINAIIVGTKAIEDEAFLDQAVKSFAEHLVIGVDAKDGMAATGGWLHVTERKATDFIAMLENKGVKRIVYTDIATDGALKGTNVPAFKEILSLTQEIAITASGGVTTLEDIQSLLALKDSRLWGAIVGRALYEGHLDLKEALREASHAG